MIPSNPVAVITGASRGIGRAVAKALAFEGARVVVNFSRSQNDAESLCLEINDECLKRGNGGSSVSFKADCSNFDDVQAMFVFANKSLGPVDILVNNAGITRPVSMKKMKQNDFTDVIDLNLNGALYCAKAAYTGSMMDNKRGRIINMASMLGTEFTK